MTTMKQNLKAIVKKLGHCIF